MSFLINNNSKKLIGHLKMLYKWYKIANSYQNCRKQCNHLVIEQRSEIYANTGHIRHTS